MGSVKNTPTREDIITDLKEVASSLGKVVSKRDYLANGKYKYHFEKYFSWGEFLKEALGLEVTVVQPKEHETQTLSGNDWKIDLQATRIHTLDELLEFCKVDLSIWAVKTFSVNKWEVGAKDALKNIKVTPLYQVKAVLEKRIEIVDAKAEIEKLKIEFKKTAPIKKRISDVAKSYGNMLEINIPDSHFGKMSWSVETGGRNYDTPIAARTFLRALNGLLTRGDGYKYDKILFVVGNDLINSDDEQGRTTKGTFVSTDGRYQKTFLTVRKTITESIELLRQIAPVEVVMVSGNHDNLGVWHLGDSLECLYENTEDVTINNEPKQFKIIRHGKVLLGLTHGDKGKRQDYPLFLATEYSKDFGETLFREVHTGHVHQTQTQEWHGVRVRILPSLSPADAWHAENGFTGQQRNAEAYVWNNKEGLIAMFFFNDDAQPEITTKRIIKEG